MFRVVLSALVVVVASVGSAGAASITIALPELRGTFSNQPVIPIDLGTAFTSISEVRLDIEAVGTPWIFERCTDPSGCEQFQVAPSLSANLDIEDTAPVRLVFGATDEYGPSRETHSLYFSDRDESWNFLLDGQGSMGLYIQEFAFLPTDPVVLLLTPTLQIWDSSLTVVGTPVPEPGTGVLLVAGLCGFALRARSG